MTDNIRVDSRLKVAFLEATKPRKEGGGKAIITIDDEDLEKVLQVSREWRVMTCGYVVAARHKELVYLHVVVMDGPSRHVSGDRSDCRKCNLMKRNIKPRSINPPFEIQRLDNDAGLAGMTSIGTCTYTPNKAYHGSMLGGIPHGIGILTIENDDDDVIEQIVGLWIKGHLEIGMVVKCKHESLSGDAIVLEVPLEISSFELVRDGFRLYHK